jgi:hypothetical protein
MTLYVQKDVYHNVPGGTHGCNRLCFRSVSHCLIVIVRANYFTSLVPLQTLENVLLLKVSSTFHFDFLVWLDPPFLTSPTSRVFLIENLR